MFFSSSSDDDVSVVSSSADKVEIPHTTRQSKRLLHSTEKLDESQPRKKHTVPLKVVVRAKKGDVAKKAAEAKAAAEAKGAAEAKKAAEVNVAAEAKKAAESKKADNPDATPRTKSITAIPKKPSKIQVARMKASAIAARKKNGFTPPKRQPRFSAEEDVFICRAYINISCDPITGTDQKGTKFWSRVADQVNTLYREESDAPIDGHRRNSGAILTRYQRHIQPDVFAYNRYHLQVSTPKKSGWTLDDYVREASILWANEKGEPFRFPNCIEIMHQMAKYQPGFVCKPQEGEDGEEIDGRIFNDVGHVMGDEMIRPMGQKAAKKKEKEEKMNNTKASSSKKVNMDGLESSANNLANAIKEGNRLENDNRRCEMWMKQADMYMKLNKTEKANEFLEKIEQLQNQTTGCDTVVNATTDQNSNDIEVINEN